MKLSADEVAGVVDLFGAVTRDELDAALAELAYRRGHDTTPAVLAEAAEAALDDYYLVEVERDGVLLLAPGPVAFPTLPDGAEDLPHIVDFEGQQVERESLGEALLDRFREEAATAIDEGDAERVAELLDLTYDAEAWAPVDLGDLRERLTVTMDE